MVDGRRVDTIQDFTIDAEQQRALVTVGVGTASQLSWLVVAIDLANGKQSLLYDGSPTADGGRPECAPSAAFDTGERRLLLAEPISSDCGNRVFAVDPDTGTFTLVADRIE